jgi:lipoprotein-releasing system permease protein
MAVAPYTQLQGMLTANGQVTGAMISGIDPVYEKQFLLSKNTWAGQFRRLTS